MEASDAQQENWEDDLLNRKEDAEFIITFLKNRLSERERQELPRSFVLNIDAEWGFGKTYFLSRLEAELRARGHLVASVNAWRDDHADDPLIAVMAAIDDTVQRAAGSKQLAKDAWQNVKRKGAAVIVAATKGAALHWGRKLIGDGADEIAKAVSEGAGEEVEAAKDAAVQQMSKELEKDAEALIASFKNAQSAIDAFKGQLEEFLDGIGEDMAGPPLFVLVDELDRCRPSYAISLLERVKHLFGIDNVAFVIATDTDQLRHAVSVVYGSGFNSEGYLHRFFDGVYRFDDPSLGEFVRSLCAKNNIDTSKFSVPPNSDVLDFIIGGFEHFDLKLRDAEQCLEALANIATVWSEPIPIELVVLLPMIVGSHFSIAPALTEEFANEVEKKVGMRRSRVRPHWQANFAGNSVNAPGNNFPNMGLFQKFARDARNTLVKIQRSSHVDVPEKWVRDRFSNEFASLHRSQYHGDGPVSVLQSYPRLVRSAGRLSLSQISAYPNEGSG